ncbi:MAG: hypothetical protein KGI71_05765, partial [Patescibacteria group bacterium]|nr:hypothetical protein [Patescibacteria group bacterium]
MAIKPNDSTPMLIGGDVTDPAEPMDLKLPEGAAAEPSDGSMAGGTPRGWTLISSEECARRLFLRYVIGLYKAEPQDHFSVGSSYHAFMEGKSAAEVEKVFGKKHATEGARLANIRRTQGAPLAQATAVEKQSTILGGLMTSKPDREELVNGKRVVRDFKTAMMLSSRVDGVDKDERYWNVNGGIIGECLAADTDTALVDIVRKTPGSPSTKLVVVKVDRRKAEALKAHAAEFWRQLEERLGELAGKDRVIAKWVLKQMDEKALREARELLNATFPPSLTACVGKYECDYYDRCFGSPPASLMFKLGATVPRKWVPEWMAKLVEKFDEKALSLWRQFIGSG